MTHKKEGEGFCIQIENITRMEEQNKQNMELHQKLNGTLEKLHVSLDELRKAMNKNFSEVHARVSDVQFKRLPLWATILFTVMGSVIVGLLVKGG